MSATAIFAIGVVIFMITIYGTIVAAGLAMTDRQLEDEPNLERSDSGPLPVPDDY
jgi:hypothetical protein